MEDTDFRKITTAIILVALIVLAFLLLKPILMSIILAFILAFIFSPIYNWVYKVTKAKNLSASLVCLLLILIIILPIWFLTPIILKQSFAFFGAVQEIDFVTPLKTIFPSFFASEQFSTEVGHILSSFVSKSTSYIVNELSLIILEFPVIFLQLLVVFFTFFFVLRDKKELIDYIKSLLPFSKEVEKKLFEYSKGITTSVIYGQVIIGMIQGLVASIGFFIFGVPNALFLSLIATLAGVLPIIGTVLVWVPVVIYLLLAGNVFAAVGVAIFGIISSSVDNFLRPFIVSKRVHMQSSVVLIGMIGGLFLFGVLGLILGPLILAYLLIILEIYRNKKISGVFINPSK